MARSTLGLFVAIITRSVVSLLILGIGLTIYVRLVDTRPTLDAQPRDDVAQSVVVFEPRQVEIRRQWPGFGTAQALVSADVPARVTAEVVEIPEGIDAGARVSAGDLLARLDDSDFRRQAEVAQGTLDEIDAQLQRLDVEKASWEERVALAERDAALAMADVERVRDAIEGGAALPREVDAATQRAIAIDRIAVAAREELDKIPARRAGLQAMRASQDASLALATLSIERCRIEAPIDGVLQSAAVEFGEMVTPGHQVARVVNLDRVEVPLRLPASARPQLRVGDDVTLFDAGNPPGRWTATIARIAPEDDPETRTVFVFAELDNRATDRVLPPGRFVEAVVVSGAREPRTVVPRRSIRSDRIFVVADDRIVQREVIPAHSFEGALPELGLPDTSWVVLREPLPEGDLVVLDGARVLPVGAPAAPILADSAEHRADARDSAVDRDPRPESAP